MILMRQARLAFAPLAQAVVLTNSLGAAATVVGGR